MLPTYCNEELNLVQNPEMCGCLSGYIISPDKKSCINLATNQHREDNSFEIADDVRMRIRNSELMECEKGDYLAMELRIVNDDTSPFPLVLQDIPMLIESGDGEYAWTYVEYPQDDSECSEPSRFAWTYTMEGDTNSGLIWYDIGEWDDEATYYVFYKGEAKVKLSPFIAD
jgi:hypothetical protein